MSCNHPLKGFWTGSYTESGKKDYFICPETAGNVVNAGLASRKGHKITPGAHMIRQGDEILLTDPVAIPCGHCVGCRMDRAKEWKVRLVHESASFPGETHFVTLTYRDECLPVNEFGEPYVKKSDAQNFMKRLRKYSGNKYRFFLCSEYGGLNKRPHFHLILFGKLDDLIPFEFKRYHSSLIEKAWPYGLSEISPANENCMAYVAGYVEKKANDPEYDSYPVKPFLLMSRKPALGSNYLNKLDGSPDRKVYGNFGSNHFAGIPRAYLKKCEDKPWYKDYKEESERLAKIYVAQKGAMYGTVDEDLQGFLADEYANKRLEDVRKDKL